MWNEKFFSAKIYLCSKQLGSVSVKRIAIFIVLLTMVMINTAYAENFVLTHSSVKFGERGVAIDRELVFEYSHRIDPFDIEIVVNGGAVPASYQIIEGKKLIVIPNEPLECETSYHLSVNNVRDIYEGRQPQSQQFNFQTENAIKVISETSSPQTGQYIGKVKNISSSPKEVVCIVTAKADLEEEMYDYKVLTQTIPANSETEFKHTFSNADYPYRICAYTFSDFSKLTPADKLNNENN